MMTAGNVARSPGIPARNGFNGLFCALVSRRTLEDDLIDGATFDNLAQFADELMQYMIYYNEFRPHQALGGLTPKAFAQSKSHV